ncbi:hypothetical protein A2477_01050 [Candidatus Falkowbacteria bacterium RIFOXYC2_FULL_47_12]|uniref:Uncharacterized protein n=1 Tax=Candidatus Falkowbacteria bacterium RIFOXYC2_FULL_47_12 TaxID=1798004 RepID=A0A1F5TQR7_9BACT|nr:MAG: hypothetical protein A2477_01050 [Candidatus Falkowbacteria bacterium RIFOXYC2_FULL_47_12]
MKKLSAQKSVVVLDIREPAEPAAKDGGGFAIPAWMDCTWRRIPCGKLTCPICGRMVRVRARHIARGEDPDDLAAVFADMGENFSETLRLLREDARQLGVDLEKEPDEPPLQTPEPDAFPLYGVVKNWQECLEMILAAGYSAGASWVITDVYADLSWYGNALLAKTYRQLCAAWEKKYAPTLFGEADFRYTRDVLAECCAILTRNLRELLPLSGDYFVPVSRLLSTLAFLRERLRSL